MDLTTSSFPREFQSTKNSMNHLCAIIVFGLRSGLLGGVFAILQMVLLPSTFAQPAAPIPSAISNKSTARFSESKSMDKALVLNGCPVFAIDALDLPAKETGVLLEVHCELNSKVKKGDVLARLDDQAAQLEKAIAGLQAQVAVSEANDTSDVRFSEALVEEARIGLEKYEEMKSRGSASDTELRQKQLGVSQAELKLLNAKQAVEQRKLRAKIAQSSLLVAEDKIGKLRLAAPYDGTITEIYKKAGEWVQAGQPICKVVRLDELRVDCHVKIDQINPEELVGMPVMATASRAGFEPLVFSGVLTSFDPEVSSLGTLKAHATIQNQPSGDHWKLVPGMTVSLQLHPEAPRGSLIREPKR